MQETKKSSWFADEIYLRARMFASSVKQATEDKKHLFSRVWEALCRYKKRAFDVQQVKWNITASTSQVIIGKTMDIVMKCAIMLQNMCEEKLVSLKVPEKKGKTFSTFLKVRHGLTFTKKSLVRMSRRAIISTQQGW